MECSKTTCERPPRFVLEAGGDRWPACAEHLAEAVGIVRMAVAPPGVVVRIHLLTESP